MSANNKEWYGFITVCECEGIQLRWEDRGEGSIAQERGEKNVLNSLPSSTCHCHFIERKSSLLTSPCNLIFCLYHIFHKQV